MSDTLNKARIVSNIIYAMLLLLYQPAANAFTCVLPVRCDRRKSDEDRPSSHTQRILPPLQVLRATIVEERLC